MKTIFYPLVIVFALVLLSGTSEDDDQKNSIQGVWELENRYTYDNNTVIDTIHNVDGYRQIKMYHEGKVMWTRFVPKDSVEWFGYGSYNTTDNALQEKLEYGSASMMRIIDTMRIFSFKLVTDKNHFSQITIDDEGNSIFSENYKRIK
ncbi:hypothetical protein [Galbibacter pacificus]|uniref:Lipocalin-like domain-containing protein n=1 Tax=Galbibacter pacificus TaxID=2996052 RepID=A0ABT6FUV6_9FLAO|nr:hypothetical protein [Galbibacter pacificus]MDG3583486.1 hypothetical protein [Galbibacter pacificus]MDG3587037.1 hypothetical protein [Galbibacter pacificus]